MRDLAVFVLVSFGLTTLITRSSLVAWTIRAVGLARWPSVVKGLRCAQCMGFWVGIVVSFFGVGDQTPMAPGWTFSSFRVAVLSGLISSGVAWFLTTLANPYQEVHHD